MFRPEDSDDAVTPTPAGPAGAPATSKRPSRALLRAERPPVSRLGRFLALSLVFHGAVLAAGLSGGSSYARRAGVEGRPAMILFPIDAQPEPAQPVVVATAEPERPLERELDSVDEPRPRETLPEFEPAPQAPAWDALAELVPPSAIDWGSEALEQAIGDPRATLSSPSHEIKGLAMGLAVEPPVSDCCGEPQPSPAAPPVADVYVYPKVLKMARAQFPERSQRLGETGSVLLEMTVGPDGLVKDVRVAQTSGYARLDDCARNAAWDWVFEPARRNGVPETSVARHRYRFRLTGAGG